MQRGERKFIHRYDLWIIIGLLLGVAVLAYLTGRQSDAEVLQGHIYVDGVLVKTLSLDGSERSFYFPEIPEVEFSVSESGIAFIHSDCPDQVCVHTGWLNRPGQFAACVPNQVLLVIVGDQETPVDSITR